MKACKWVVVLVAAAAAVQACATRKQIRHEPPETKAEPGLRLSAAQQERLRKAVSVRESGDLTGEKGDGIFESGVASWYGLDFHRQQTANGEIYDMYKLTAAHRTLPFNTLVEVENLANQRTVLVRINDRGPFLKNRIIDLSLAGARRLGIEESGTAPVNLRIVRGGTDFNGHDTGLRKQFYLQVGAFSLRDNALATMRNAAAVAPPGTVFEIVVENGLYKVVSQRLATRPEAEELSARLAAAQIDNLVKEWVEEADLKKQ